MSGRVRGRGTALLAAAVVGALIPAGAEGLVRTGPGGPEPAGAAAFVAPDAAGGHMVRLIESQQLPWLCVVDGTRAADGSVGAGPVRAEEPTGGVGGVVHHEDLARYALRR